MGYLRLHGSSVSSHLLIEIVDLYQRHANNDVLAAHNRGVSARWQVCYDCRLACIRRRMPAVLNIHDLVAGDNPAADSSLPVIVIGNDSTAAVVQFQCGISQYVSDAEPSEFGANSPHDYPLGSGPAYNEPSDHHVVALKNTAATADI